MESYLAEEASWASGLASRLRLVQANFADDQAAARQAYIAEEVERGLKGVAPSKRKAYLNALAVQFPAWQSASRTSAPAGQKDLTPESPESLLHRLVEVSAQLPPERKKELARELQKAGWLAPEQATPTLELPVELQKKLGMGPGQALNLERAVRLAAALSEMVLALDQLVWALWRQLAARSGIRKEAELVKLMGPYLGGDPEVSTQQITQSLEKTRRLIAGLLGAIGRAGATYARSHAARFAPEVIEDWARMEKRWSEGLEQVCWRKYVEQAKEYATEPAIENEIQEGIAKSAENLVMGRSAT